MYTEFEVTTGAEIKEISEICIKKRAWVQIQKP
jgi:hypothetical protein